MGTTENPTTEAPKPQQSKYETIDETIVKMKLTFDNATLPEIFAAMVVVGYTEEKIAHLQAKLSNLETLQQVQTKEYAEQYSQTEEFKKIRKEVDVIYTKDRKLAQILFNGNIHAQSSLKLTETKPLEYAAWKLQVANFYTQLTSTSKLLAQAETIGINVNQAEAQKQKLVEVQNAKDSQGKEASEAQDATDVRNRAYDELYPLYSEYIQYAKVLLPNNQILEAIGIKVKAN